MAAARANLISSDVAMTALFQMISINLFRTPKVSVAKFGGQLKEDNFNQRTGDETEETQILLEEQWPHLQIVYELLLRVVILRNLNKDAFQKNYLNFDFVARLINLFQSPDPRERDYLKSVVHRIYGKFMPLRLPIRMTLVRELVMETVKSSDEAAQNDRTFGLAEYLDILVPIIEGFSTPLRNDHRQIFNDCLLPLHRSRNLSQFRQQLVKAVTKFILKDQSLAEDAILTCLKYWPLIDPHKEVSSLTELESIFNILKSIDPLLPIGHYLTKRLSLSISSLHFNVAERAILLLHNPVLLCLIRYQQKELLPLLVDALQSNMQRNEHEYLQMLGRNGVYVQRGYYVELAGAHWSKTVRGMSLVAIKLLAEHTNRHKIEALSNTYSERILNKELHRYQMNQKWKQLEQSLDKSSSK